MTPFKNFMLVKQDDVVQEEQSRGGLLLLKSNFNLYQFGDDGKRAYDIIHKTKVNQGKVVSIGDECVFAIPGQQLIYRKRSEQKELGDYVLVKEDDLLCVNTEAGLTPHPGKVIIKIS